MCRLSTKISQNFWRAGIETTNSCEDNVPQGYVWIEFASEYDLQKFLIIVVDDEEHDSEFYNRVFVAEYPNSWRFKINYSDVTDDNIDTPRDYYCCIDLSFSVRFPMTDYDRVLSKFLPE